MRNAWMLVRLFSLLILVGAFGCECTPPATDGGVADGGRVFARAVEGGGLEIVLDDLPTPLRTLQVDIALTGGEATDVVSAGAVAFNILEAALDAPRADLTLVVADTRRLPLNNGAIARLVTSGDAEATLTNAFAVDDDGERRTLATSAD